MRLNHQCSSSRWMLMKIGMVFFFLKICRGKRRIVKREGYPSNNTYKDFILGYNVIWWPYMMPETNQRDINILFYCTFFVDRFKYKCVYIYFLIFYNKYWNFLKQIHFICTDFKCNTLGFYNGIHKSNKINEKYFIFRYITK